MASPGQTFTKDPDELLVYEFDWTDALTGPDGAGTGTISTSTFAFVDPVADALLVKDNPTIVSGNLKTRVRLSVGTVGKTYGIANRVTTNESPAQTYERTIYIKVVEK